MANWFRWLFRGFHNHDLVLIVRQGSSQDIEAQAHPVAIDITNLVYEASLTAGLGSSNKLGTRVDLLATSSSFKLSGTVLAPNAPSQAMVIAWKTATAYVVVAEVLVTLLSIIAGIITTVSSNRLDIGLGVGVGVVVLLCAIQGMIYWAVKAEKEMSSVRHGH